MSINAHTKEFVCVICMWSISALTNESSGYQMEVGSNPGHLMDRMKSIVCVRKGVKLSRLLTT